MTRVLRSFLPLVAFAACLATIYGTTRSLVPRLDRFEHDQLVAGALTLALTVLVPLLYYLLLVRRRGWPAITLLPLFIVCVLVARRLIPESHHRVVELLIHATVVAEIAIVVIIVRKMLQLRRAYRNERSGLDILDALRESALSVLGPVAGNVLAYEVAVFYYVLCGWRRAPRLGPAQFTYHRKLAYVPIAAVVLMAASIETVSVHLLLSQWSNVAAWILTAIGIYALVWLTGDTHAIRLRPVEISETALHVRLGLRWTIDVPLASIDGVGPAEGGTLPRSTPAYLKVALLGAPSCRIKLNGPVEAVGPYGLCCRVETIDLRLDEPERFIEQMKNERGRVSTSDGSGRSEDETCPPLRLNS